MIKAFFGLLATSFLFPMLVSCGCKEQSCHELANKPIYADLQGLEFDHRQTVLDAPLYLRGAVDSGKYDVLGLPAKAGQYPNIWIAVNTNDGSDGVLAVPGNEDIRVSCDFVRKLHASEKVDEVVSSFLTKKCVN